MLTPLMELRDLKFAVSSLATGHSGGSCQGEMAKNAARGINDRLDWVIATLETAKEGGKNMGVSRGYRADHE